MAPHRLGQRRKSLAGDSRNAMKPEAERLRALRQRLHAGIVRRVHLVGGDDLRAAGELGPEELELTPENVEILDRIPTAGARDVHDVDQHLRPLEMPQELMPEAQAAMRSLD